MESAAARCYGRINGDQQLRFDPLTYDAIGQLRQAILNGDSTNAGSNVWNYDPAGNRIGVQSGSATLSTAVPTSAILFFVGVLSKPKWIMIVVIFSGSMFLYALFVACRKIYADNWKQRAK